MGLTNTTTNLSYARNELIKVGASFIFDKVGDMIYYMLANDDISTASTTASTITTTDADGGGYGLKIVNTFTKVGATAHKAMWSDLTYTPASTGTACPIAVVGKVSLNGNLTRANNYPGYGWGVQGQIHIVTGTTIGGTTDYDPGPVYAALRGVTTDAGTSTYTDGTITSLYAETQISQAAATGSFRVFLAWLRCQGSGTSTDIDAALYIDSGNAWGNNITVGVDINDCVTAIDIGTCTTGINVGANLVIPTLMTIGTTGNGIHWDGVAEGIMIYGEATDVTMSTKTFAKIQLSAPQSAALTSGRLECFRAETISYSTNNVSAGNGMRALVGQISFSGNCTYNGTAANGAIPLIGCLWSGSNLTCTGDAYALGLFVGVETGSAFNGESAFCYMYNFGKTAVESLFNVYIACTPSVPTYLFNFLGAVLGSYSNPCTTDSVATNSGGSDGAIKIRIGTTTYEIPIFAE